MVSIFRRICIMVAFSSGGPHGVAADRATAIVSTQHSDFQIKIKPEIASAENSLQDIENRLEAGDGEAALELEEKAGPIIEQAAEEVTEERLANATQAETTNTVGDEAKHKAVQTHNTSDLDYESSRQDVAESKANVQSMMGKDGHVVKLDRLSIDGMKQFDKWDDDIDALHSGLQGFQNSRIYFEKGQKQEHQRVLEHEKAFLDRTPFDNTSVTSSREANTNATVRA